MASQKNKNAFTRLWRHKFLSLLVFLITVVLAFWGWQTYQKRQNKVAFQEARSAIDQVYADIVSNVGQPVDSKSINSCSRHHQEFEEGPLSCAVGTSFIYAVASRDEATQKYKAVQNVIKSRPDLFKPTSQLSSEITDEFVVNTYYYSAYDKYKTDQNMECSINYIFDTPREMDLTSNSAHALQINIGCSDWVKQQLYHF